MNIKAKLTLGVGLLFALILLLSVMGMRYLYLLKADAGNILANNYNSIKYAQNMLTLLEQTDTGSVARFEEELKAQEQNLTEPGEAEFTRQLRRCYNTWRLQPGNQQAVTCMRTHLLSITHMNMEAIRGKSEQARITADRAVFWIAIAGTCCFVIAFVLLVKLPAYIAGPIQSLTNSIKQIAASNYAERVHLEDHSEYGQLARSFNSMAEKLEMYNNSNLARLMQEKQRIEALINHMQDAVIGMDEHLTVIFANEQAARITGLSLHELVHNNARDLALKNDLLRNLLRDLIYPEHASPEGDKPIKIVAENREGYYQKDVVPVPARNQQHSGYVLVLKNVTVYQELDAAKTNFMATLSHEFKTPMSSIQMGIQLLRNNKVGLLNGEQQQLLHGMEDDLNRLLNITGELLNMTQVESGHIQLNIRTVSVNTLIAYALQAVERQAMQQHTHLVWHAPEVEIPVQADGEKSAWVLVNLLANAIRYSPAQAEVQVTVAEQNGEVCVAIHDNGPGIAPEFQHKVFERYFRVPGTQHKGTGLGLAISREFIEGQGGRITLHSQPGQGSTFEVYFVRGE